jgi:glycosyltransferase involved in cell wall biosynthesis
MILVHCRWMPWWGRDVALSLLRTAIKQWHYPQKIYTLFSDTSSVTIDNHTIPIITPWWSWRNTFFVGSPKRPKDHRLWFFLTPLLVLWISFRLRSEASTTILISSFAVSKNLWLWKKHRRHLYLHSANQYVWSHYKEYATVLTGWKRRLFILWAPLIRFRDKHTNTWPHTPRSLCMANSPDTKRRASKLYRRPSITIVIPQVSSLYLNRSGHRSHDHIPHGVSLDYSVTDIPCHPAIPSSRYGTYMIVVGRVSWVIRHHDRILTLCQKRRIPLVIVGDWPDYTKTLAMAQETTRCLGRCDHETILPLLLHAKWLINLAHESFGLNMMEALILGTPVLARDCGNAPYIIDHRSWILIPDLTDQSLEIWLDRFLSTRFYHEDISSRAKQRYNRYLTTWTITFPDCAW